LIVKYCDFNNSYNLIANSYQQEWKEVEDALTRMPLHLKASDQEGLQGKPIFDPVGANDYIKEALKTTWDIGIPIPEEAKFLGLHIDFGKRGAILEAQFSNYPFLLNNLLRGEFFYKAKLPLSGECANLIIVITKSWKFPSSNSTLYYEQAIGQIRALAQYRILEAPLRLVGLFESIATTIPITWTEYHSPRYSRTVVSRVDKRCEILAGQTPQNRCRIRIIGA
jgi:hypothetical protein